MNNILKDNNKKNIYNIIICAWSIGIFIAVLWRIQCSISYYDETFNIYVSYLTAVLGERHLIENSYIFSMGDLFNLPFVYFFWRITGGTEGLVLFIRFIYLGLNLFLGYVYWHALGKYYGKKEMAFSGLIFITSFGGGMYTLSYDSASLFFSLLAGVLLLGSELRDNKKVVWYRYLAGICHGCMVYAYPLMLAVILTLIIIVTILRIREARRNGNYIGKALFWYWIPYFLGGLTVLTIFFCYIIFVGWENIIFFQKERLQASLKGRELGKLMAIASDGNDVVLEGVASSAIGENKSGAFFNKIMTQIYVLLNYMWIQQKTTLGFTILMLFQWAIGLMKKGKWRLLLLPEILFVGVFMHRNVTCFVGTTMYAYCCCWAPFLFWYLKKEKRQQAIKMLIIFIPIAIASFFAIGFTSVRADKAHVGLYCGAMCTYLLMILLLKEEYADKIPVAVLFILLIATCNIGMAYIDHFQGADIKDCTYRVKKGVYKGLLTWEEDVQYEALKTYLEQMTLDDNATLYMSNDQYYAACIDGNLKKSSFNVLYLEKLIQEGENPEKIYDFTYWPDVLIIDKKDANSYINVQSMVFEKKYKLISSDYNYYLYTKNACIN